VAQPGAAALSPLPRPAARHRCHPAVTGEGSCTLRTAIARSLPAKDARGGVKITDDFLESRITISARYY